MVALVPFWVVISLWRESNPDIWVQFYGLVYKLRWVGALGSLLFYATLLLIAMDRRNQTRRIAELEAILREREDWKESP